LTVLRAIDAKLGELLAEVRNIHGHVHDGVELVVSHDHDEDGGQEQ